MFILAFIESQILASILLFVVGIFSMISGIIWTFAGDIGERKYSSTAAGILDWAVYMGAAIQAFMFGIIKDVFGWSAIFITIGSLYIIIIILTILSERERKNESINI